MKDGPSIARIAALTLRTGAGRLRSSPREPALRKARVCYDHLAGEVRLTPAGDGWFSALGIDVSTLALQRRAFCRPCLDWSERAFPSLFAQ